MRPLPFSSLLVDALASGPPPLEPIGLECLRSRHARFGNLPPTTAAEGRQVDIAEVSKTCIDLFNSGEVRKLPTRAGLLFGLLFSALLTLAKVDLVPFPLKNLLILLAPATSAFLAL